MHVVKQIQFNFKIISVLHFIKFVLCLIFYCFNFKLLIVILQYDFNHF